MAAGGVVNEVLLEEKLVGVFLPYQRRNHRQNCLQGLFIQTMELTESLGVSPFNSHTRFGNVPCCLRFRIQSLGQVQVPPFPFRRPSWVTWVSHTISLDNRPAWLSQILMFATHSEEFDSRGKNITQVWYFPHGLARQISHQKFAAHVRKQLSYLPCDEFCSALSFTCAAGFTSYLFQKTCYYGNHMTHSVEPLKPTFFVLFKKQDGEIFSNFYIMLQGMIFKIFQLKKIL